MKYLSISIFTFLLAAILISINPGAALAQESEVKEVPKMPGGWMLIMGRFGGTSDMTMGTILFDNVPRDADGNQAEEETVFGSNSGYFQVAGIDFYFFPTEAGGFLLSASLHHQTGYFNLKIENDDEYAYQYGLDKRNVNYHMVDVLGGLGYRWLRGERNQHGVTLHSKIGFGGAGMSLDGFASSSSAGSAIFEVGTGYHYRFSNSMTMGVQFDLRGYGAGFSTLEYGKGYDENEKAEFAFGGFTGLLSAVIGWEIM